MPDGVALGDALGVPLAVVPPAPLSPVSPLESVGVGVELSVPPESVGVGVGDVGVGVGDVVVGVGVGDVVVGVGVGDVALTDGVAETLGEGVGLAEADGVMAHDGVGVGDARADAAISSAFGAAGVTASGDPVADALTSTLDQSTARVGGQLTEAAGLADAPPP